MNPDRRTLLGGAMLASAVAGLSTSAAAQTTAAPSADMEVIPLWPKGPPGGEAVTVAERISDRAPAGAAVHDRAIEHTRNPTLTVVRPAKPNGGAIVIFPGGAYVRATLDKEGYDVARWFAQHGYTGFVCAYRFPGDGWAAGPDTPLQDAQRAIRLIRSKAAEYGLQPNRIAVMGFSAGGHMAASALTRYDEKVYEPVDAADALSARPDAGCLMYPVISFTPALMHEGSRRQMIGATPTAEQIDKYSTEKHVTAQTPPTFLCHAADDTGVPWANSITFFTALKAAKVATEMHLFEKGGHGFGLRGVEGKPAYAWPELFARGAADKGL
jgi:acetyl esterase/lipase